MEEVNQRISALETRVSELEREVAAFKRVNEELTNFVNGFCNQEDKEQRRAEAIQRKKIQAMHRNGTFRKLAHFNLN
jgi:hypothetical protein